MKNLVIITVVTLITIIMGCKPEKEVTTSIIFDSQVTLSPSIINVVSIANELKTKETINGNVTINTYDNSFLSCLKNIKTINGDVSIINAAITDLDFLSSLETITGSITLTTNSSFKSTKGLEKLKKIKGFILTGAFNATAVDFSPIQNLIVTDVFNLQNLPNDSLPTFTNITALNDYVAFNNIGIKNMKSLTNLSTVTNGLTISDNRNLVSLEGLNKITTVGEAIIVGNNVLPNLKGMDNLKTVKKALNISGVSLKSISNLINLTSVTTFDLSNTQCENLSGIENLIKAESVVIKNNALLSNFCALKSYVSANATPNFLITGNMQNPTVAQVKDNCK